MNAFADTDGVKYGHDFARPTDHALGMTLYRGKRNESACIRQRPSFGNRYVCIDRSVSSVLGQTTYLVSLWNSRPYESKIEELGLEDAGFHETIRALRSNGESPEVHGIMFDAGDHIDGLLDIIDELRGKDELGYTLEGVALTHTHRDHIAGLSKVIKHHNAHSDEKLQVFVGGYRPAHRLLHPMETFNPHIAYEEIVRPIHEDEISLIHVRENDSISMVANPFIVQFNALFRPGHSEDDVVFYSKSEELPIAFTGDMLFRRARKNGMYRFNFGGFGYTDSDWRMGVMSLGRLSYDLDPRTYILPGHSSFVLRQEQILVRDTRMGVEAPLMRKYVEKEISKRSSSAQSGKTP